MTTICQVNHGSHHLLLNNITINYTAIYTRQQPWSTDIAQPLARWDMVILLKKQKKNNSQYGFMLNKTPHIQCEYEYLRP